MPSGAILNACDVLRVVEEQESRCATGVDFHVDLDGVGMASDRRSEDRRIGRRSAARVKPERTVTSLEAGRIELAPEAPLES